MPPIYSALPYPTFATGAQGGHIRRAIAVDTGGRLAYSSRFVGLGVVPYRGRAAARRRGEWVVRANTKRRRRESNLATLKNETETKKWCARGGSNAQPLAPEANALSN